LDRAAAVADHAAGFATFRSVEDDHSICFLLVLAAPESARAAAHEVNRLEAGRLWPGYTWFCRSVNSASATAFPCSLQPTTLAARVGQKLSYPKIVIAFDKTELMQ